MLNSSGWEVHHDRSENICVNAVFCPPKLVQNSLFGSAPQNFYTTSSALINRGFTYLEMKLISHNGNLSFSHLFKAFNKFKGFHSLNCLNLLESLKLRLVNFANDARIIWCQLNRLVRELK